MVDCRKIIFDLNLKHYGKKYLTYHYVKHLTQLNFRSFVFPKVIYEFHCRLILTYASDEAEKNSEIKKKSVSVYLSIVINSINFIIQHKLLEKLFLKYMHT